MHVPLFEAANSYFCCLCVRITDTTRARPRLLDDVRHSGQTRASSGYTAALRRYDILGEKSASSTDTAVLQRHARGVTSASSAYTAAVLRRQNTLGLSSTSCAHTAGFPPISLPLGRPATLSETPQTNCLLLRCLGVQGRGKGTSNCRRLSPWGESSCIVAVPSTTKAVG